MTTIQPVIRLQPKTALTFAMALHELVANTIKHGALSVPGGRVAIEWRVESKDGEPRLQLRWSEHGGPPVQAPSSRGFGSRMIEAGLGSELGGTVHLDFVQAGLVCAIDAPLPLSATQAAAT